MKARSVVSHLITDPTITDIVKSKVHNGRVPTKSNGEPDLPFIWLRRRSAEFADCNNNQGKKILATWFDIECCAASPDVADDLVDAVIDSLHGYMGSMGTEYSNQTTARDQDDDYLPRNTADDSGVFVDSLLIRIADGGQ